MKQVPIVGYLAIDDGPPHLVAWEAVGSGALYFDRRNADANQGGRGYIQGNSLELSNVDTATELTQASCAPSRSCTARCRVCPRRTCRRSSTSTVAAR